MRATPRRSMPPWTRMQVMLSIAAPLARQRRPPIRRRRRNQARWCLTTLMMRKTCLGRTHVQSPSHPTRTALMSRSYRSKEEQRLQRPQTAANSSRLSKRSNSRQAEAVETPRISSRERGVTLRLQPSPKSSHQRRRATAQRRWKMMACTSSSDINTSSVRTSHCLSFHIIPKTN